MVGKLARWLRVLGIDVAYSNTYKNEEIIRIANAENRIVLTRDTGLAARRAVVRCVLIESDAWRQQVEQVVREFGLKDFEGLRGASNAMPLWKISIRKPYSNECHLTSTLPRNASPSALPAIGFSGTAPTRMKC